MELLGHMVALVFKFWGTGRFFSKAAAPFYISTSVYEGSNCSLSLPTLDIVFLIRAALLGMQWSLLVVLICISLMAADVLFIILLSHPEQEWAREEGHLLPKLSESHLHDKEPT